MARAGAADARSPEGLVLVRTKLRAPVVNEQLIRRPRLDALLDSSRAKRLCLVSAPAGFGKTALVSAWAQQGHHDGPVAWVSLDEGDNDPYRFWTYVIEAFRGVGPELAVPLQMHQASPSEHILLEVVLPHLLNVLDAAELDIVLVLDDVQVITDPVVHRSLQYLFDHLPPHVHLCLLTRVDPPLPFARLRVRGELCELRAADLAFTWDEAEDLLDRVMALGLSGHQVERLWRLTEGWAAALYLAGMSLRDGSHADDFIASFEVGDRHVFDYLGSEVLRRIPDDVRDFLMRTSILRRMVAPLCDHVCNRTDSAALIADLEAENLFLVPLDYRREWYRYHHLFAAMLRLALGSSAPDTLPDLHRRAAQWFEQNGGVEDAIHHSTEAGDHQGAARLLVSHWLTYERSGHSATVGRWLARMPPSAIAASPELSVISAWVSAKLGASRHQVDELLAPAELCTVGPPDPAGGLPIAFAAALVRAVNCFGDVGSSLLAARAAASMIGDSSMGQWSVISAVALGRAHYLAGNREAARDVLTDATRNLSPASALPFCAANAWALLSLLSDEDGEHDLAAQRAQQALHVAQKQGIRLDPLSAVAHLAHARAARRSGHLAEAEAVLTEAVTILRPDAYAVQRGCALLELALVQQARGDGERAGASLRRAQEVVASCSDPGVLGVRCVEVSALMEHPAQPHHVPGGPLTHGEDRVLRFLDTPLTQPEIAQELQLSVNTVRTHIRSVYRKLGVSSRDEAVRAAQKQRTRPAR